MATRGGGPTVAGSLGDDFEHRETVASQYYIRSPPLSQPKGMGYENGIINDDPGVNEPEDERPFIPAYPDTKEFMANYIKAPPENTNPAYPLPPQTTASIPDTGFVIPDGMVMVPANQMMMVAPQWMFMQTQQSPRAFSPNQNVNPSPSPNADLLPPPLPSLNPSSPKAPEIFPSSEYKGLGGPDTVPFNVPGAEKPSAHPDSRLGKKPLIEELFMAPTEGQRLVHNRTLANQDIARNKDRIKYSIFFHYFLGLCWMIRLAPAILDQLDIFILAIEELNVSKPFIWEWIWLISIPVTAFGLASCKKSKPDLMTIFFYGILVFGFVPVLAAIVLNFPEMYSSFSEESKKSGMQSEIKVDVVRYMILFSALQAHIGELYAANFLIKAWRPKKRKTQ